MATAENNNIRRMQNYVNCKFVDSISGNILDVTDPANGKTLPESIGSVRRAIENVEVARW